METILDTLKPKLDFEVGFHRFIVHGDDRPNPIIKLQLTRVFDAPRELVFQAWTNADQIKEWFNDRFASVESRDRHEQGWTGCLNALGQFIAK